MRQTFWYVYYIQIDQIYWGENMVRHNIIIYVGKILSLSLWCFSMILHSRQNVLLLSDIHNVLWTCPETQLIFLLTNCTPLEDGSPKILSISWYFLVFLHTCIIIPQGNWNALRYPSTNIPQLTLNHLLSFCQSIYNLIFRQYWCPVMYGNPTHI